MPIDSLLASTHTALVTAIKTSPHTSSSFRRVFAHQDKPGRLKQQSIGDLPAIEILPAAFSSAWRQNQSQDLVYRFQISIWTAEWSSVESELLYLKTIAALQQSLDTPGTPGYVYRLLEASDAVLTLEQIDEGPTVTKCTWTQPVMAGRWNPRTVTP